MRFLISLLLFIFLSKVTLGQYTKISECGQGWVVPTKIQSEKGACGLPIPEGIGRVSLSSLGFNSGASCGECYEIIGPNGNIVVMAFDSCGAGYACTQNDVNNFIISDNDFNKIVNGSEYSNIYNAGFQKVSCGFTSSIKANFIKPSSGTSNYQYYLGVSFASFNVAIKSIGIKGVGMSEFEKLKLETSKWSWNKNKVTLNFPATMALKSATGEVVYYEISKPPTAGTYIDTGVQFHAYLNIDFENSTCGMGFAPEYVYQDTLGFGWANYQSWGYDNLTLTSTDIDKDGAKLGVKGKIMKTKLQSFGGIKFTRDGGFPTDQISKLQFTMKTSLEQPIITIYFDINVNFTFTNASSTWGIYTVDISNLKPQPIEYSLTFMNSADSECTFWIDNIQFINEDGAINPPAQVTVAPDPNVKTSTSPGKSSNRPIGTGNTIGTDISTDNTIGGESDSNSESEENSDSQNENSGSNQILSSILLILLLNLILLF